MDRVQLFDALCNLPPQDFERLLFALKPPGGLIPGPEAPQMNRVKALLDWAQGSSGRGIDEVQDCFDRLKKGTLREPELPMPNFQPYLESILSDEDYLGWQEVYTTTTVEGRKQVNQPKLSPRLKLRVEAVKPPKEGPENEGAKEQVEQWDVLAGLREYAAEHVLLIAKPGSGKSTSLERLLWEEAENALRNPAAKIPVLVKLRRCTSTLEHLIQDFFSRHQLLMEVAVIEYLLQQEKLLLLLDGLNELPEAFGTEIANFRDRHRKTTSMIFSTRDLAVGGTLGITKTLKMLPLSEPQMREFVRGYLGEDGDRLYQQLKGDRLRKFAETPLLLWMLCRVFVQNGQVPANLGLAFREFTQLYDQGTEEQKAIQEDAPVESRKQWPKLLRYLAFRMHDCKSVDPRLLISREEAEDVLADCLQQEGRANARENAERWLQDLLDYHLLQPVMQPNHVEHIEFRHQLIQEYYAAEYLWRLLPELSDEQLKRDYLNYLKWTEPIALMLVLVDEEAQALRVVKLAIDDVDLMLGARLSGEVKQEFRENTHNLVMKVKAPQRIINHVLSFTQFIPDSSSSYDFLFERNERSKDSLERLVNFLYSPDYDIRAYTIGRLSQKYSNESIEVLEKFIEEAPDLDSCILAILALARIGNFKFIHLVEEVLDDEDWSVRLAAVQAIGLCKYKPLVHKIIGMLADEDFDVRGEAAKALYQFGSEQAFEGILDALLTADKEYLYADDFRRFQIENRFVVEVVQGMVDAPKDLQESALRRLRNIGSKVALRKSIEDLQIVIESKPEQWTSTVEALAAIGSQQAIEVIVELLDKEIIDDENLQLITVPNIVERLKLHCAIPSLIKLAHSPLINESIVNALTSLNVIEVWPRLVQLWRQDWGMQYYSLIAGLQKRCKYYNYEIRQQATQNSKLETQKGDGHKKAETHQHFHGPVYGVAGNVEGNQIITPPPSSID